MELKKPYDLLRADAKKLLPILRRLDDSSADEPDRRQEILIELRNALERRREIRDRHLYPSLSSTHAADEEIARARAQQDRAFDRLAQLEQTPPDTREFGLLAASLSSEIRLHLEHDENVVFPKAERSISEEEEAQITEALLDEYELGP